MGRDDGQKKRKEAQTRSELIAVRLTLAERRLIEQEADAIGLGLSALIRMVCLERLNHKRRNDK
jgi:hypothetical protein